MKIRYLCTILIISLNCIVPQSGFSMKLLKTQPDKTITKEPFDWKKPEPGHFIDGARQMIVGGTNITLHLSGGSAQIDIPTGEGKCFIPGGVRFKEKVGTGSYGPTKKAPLKGPEHGTWYKRDKRRLVFLGGRQTAPKDTPLVLTGDSWLIARCYNAVVHYEIEELPEPVRYVSPLRDPKKEAEEEASLKRLKSRDPYIRAKEKFVRDGGLTSDSYYAGNIFNGF